MAFTNNTKIRPVVIKAIVESTKPEAKKSLASTQIILLGKRIEQLDSDILFAKTERQRIKELRDDLLNNFPEGDEP